MICVYCLSHAAALLELDLTKVYGDQFDNQSLLFFFSWSPCQAMPLDSCSRS